MIDSAAEDLLLLSEARTYLKGRGVSIRSRATLYRWASPVGVRGIRLETLLVGGRRFTSRQALQRFFAAGTANSSLGAQ